MNQTVFNTILERYPQIGLPIKEGAKDTLEYEKAVLRGLPIVHVANDFSDNKCDCLETEDTPAGEANILYMDDREDFEKVIQKLAHRCEPTKIPTSMGASTISGLINWEKIHQHEKEYKEGGGAFWGLEFSLFVSEPENFQDSLIVLSSGEYSAVDSESINEILEDEEHLSKEEWKKASIIIRKYHELTHFICQKLYPEHKNAIRDEIIADAIGIIAVFGEYKEKVAKLFLGIEKDTYREGGRLQNYYFENDPKSVQENARDLITHLTKFLEDKKEKTIYDLIIQIEENAVGLNNLVTAK